MLEEYASKCDRWIQSPYSEYYFNELIEFNKLFSLDGDSGLYGFQTSINASHCNYWKIILFILYPNEGTTVKASKTSGGKASQS